MKVLNSIALGVFAVISLSMTRAIAKDCQTIDGMTFGDQSVVRLFYKSSPRTEIGPAYTCIEVSRQRTCLNGEFSNIAVRCRNIDSGGCADSWLERMEDNNFAYGNCQD